MDQPEQRVLMVQEQALAFQQLRQQTAHLDLRVVQQAITF
jgi:hypothetical protein